MQRDLGDGGQQYRQFPEALLQSLVRWAHNIALQLTLVELAICRERSCFWGVIGN